VVSVGCVAVLHLDDGADVVVKVRPSPAGPMASCAERSRSRRACADGGLPAPRPLGPPRAWSGPVPPTQPRPARQTAVARLPWLRRERTSKGVERVRSVSTVAAQIDDIQSFDPGIVNGDEGRFRRRVNKDPSEQAQVFANAEAA
jgi:hypothetical protein